MQVQYITRKFSLAMLIDEDTNVHCLNGISMIYPVTSTITWYFIHCIITLHVLSLSDIVGAQHY